MRFAVLMTCHNRAVLTLRSLSFFKKAALGLRYDIFLVDDGSSDGTGLKVRKEYPDVRVIDADGSLYWAKGMRLAWETAAKNADYDFYLWLNDDLELKADALAGLFADYDAIKSVVVGACSDDKSETACSYGVSDSHDRKIVPFGRPQHATGWLNGNLVLVPREVYKRIGMISDEYSHARADYDYAERLKTANIPFYCSSRYVGVCKNDFADRMRNKTLCERILMIRKPSYWNIHDLWLFKRRHYGFLKAMLSCGYLLYLVVKGVDK